MTLASDVRQAPTQSQARTSVDALPALLAYAVVLLAVPSELIVHPLGAAGTPAQIVGIGLLLWWCLSGLATRRETRANPVKWLLLVLVVALVISYVAGMSRPINIAAEVNSSDRAMLSLASWAGVVLVMADGLPSRRHLDILLRVVGVGVTGIAVLGMTQFFFGLDVAHLFHIPGLTANGEFGAALERSSFRRVTGTTQHPIEFGVVLSSTLPAIIHFARFSETTVQRRWWWVAVAVVAAALPMSVARSAVLGGVIVAVYLFHTWPTGLQRRMLAAAVVGVGLMTVVVPGLLGTIRGLIFNASSDPSTQGRTDDYAPAWRYIEQRPWFGRGFGTFIPGEYRTLDNQYLGLLIEAGFIGVGCVLVLFLGTACVAGSIRRRVPDESTRDLAQGLKAAVMVIAINAVTFDAFGFPMCVGILFLYIGAVGALRSFTAPVPRRRVHGPSPRLVGAATVAVLLAWVIGLFTVRSASADYTTVSKLLLRPTHPMVDQTVFDGAGATGLTTSVLHDVMDSAPVRRQLAADHVTGYTVAVGDGSLMMGTDVNGFGPALSFETTAATPARADADMQAVLARARTELAGMQSDVGVAAKSQIRTQEFAEQAAGVVPTRPSRALAGLVVLLALGVGAVSRLQSRTTAPVGDSGGTR